MIFPQTTEYAFRAMAYLATVPPGEPVRSADLSDHTGIPAHYLSKVMRRLVVAGLLDSKRGHNGGFSLRRPPDEITFLEIAEATDFEPSPDRCAFGYERCDKDHPCLLHDAWSRLNDRFLAWARETTLADVERFASRPEVRLSHGDLTEDGT